MFTVQDAKGKLISAPMTTQHFESFEKELWFIGSKKSSLVQALRTPSEVNLSYADASAKDYLSLSGTAQLVDNPEKLAELWSDFYEVYFESENDPDIQLISVTPTGLEYWKSNGTLVNLFELGKALATGEKADLGERHSLRIQ